MESTRGTCDRADKSYVTQVHQGTGGISGLLSHCSRSGKVATI